MFEALAGSIMAAKIHFAQMKYPFIKKKDRTVAECVYQNEVNKVEIKEAYEKSLLPESGYMTEEEYETKSRAKSRKEIAEEKKGGEIPKDSNIEFVKKLMYNRIRNNYSN